MAEPLFEVLIFASTSLALLAFLWLVARAFQVRWGWGIGTLVCPPIGFVFAAKHGREAREPLLWMGLSGLVALGTWIFAFRPKSVVPGAEALGQSLAVEQKAVLILALGLLVLFVGFAWLVVEAFQTRWTWGLGTLAFAPIVGPIFAIKHARRAWGPLATMLVGALTLAAPILIARFTPIDLGPRDKIVNGERHLTLNGWDRPVSGYRIISERPDTVLLQMANPDVDDATLEHLSGLKQLRELDLNNTRITDAGLPALAALPALETLRLSGTGITDAGFQRYLAKLPTLKRIDLRGTGVTAETIQAWRQAQPGRRVMR